MIQWSNISNIKIEKDDKFDCIINGLCLDENDNLYAVGTIVNSSFINKYTNLLRLEKRQYVPVNLSTNQEYYTSKVQLNEVCMDNSGGICVVGTKTENIRTDIYLAKLIWTSMKKWMQNIGKT